MVQYAKKATVTGLGSSCSKVALSGHGKNGASLSLKKRNR